MASSSKKTDSSKSTSAAKEEVKASSTKKKSAPKKTSSKKEERTPVAYKVASAGTAGLIIKASKYNEDVHGKPLEVIYE